MRNLQRFIKFDTTRGVEILIVLIIMGAISELNSSNATLFGPSLSKPIALLTIMLCIALVLTPLAAVFRRLVRVMEYSATAGPKDLIFIGFTYATVILGFAVIYQAAGTLTGAPAFQLPTYRATLPLLDYLYVSGVTITTVGYGDKILSNDRSEPRLYGEEFKHADKNVSP